MKAIAMKQKAPSWIVGLAVLVWTAAPDAHHSGFMYATTPVWIDGKVTGFEAVNPHTITLLEERTTDGRVRLWSVEGPGRSQLDRMNPEFAVPQVGDVMRFCAFPYKSREELSRIFPDADFSARRALWPRDDASPQFVAGHLMVTPAGDKQLWEPHGFISECMRVSDEGTGAWLEFLNSDRRARRFWCEQRAYEHVRSTPALAEFIERINRRIDDPC